MADTPRDTSIAPGGEANRPDAAADEREDGGAVERPVRGTPAGTPAGGAEARPGAGDVGDAQRRRREDRTDLPARREEDRFRDVRASRVRSQIRKDLEADDADPATPGIQYERKTREVIRLAKVYLECDQPILEDVSFSVHEGETVVVVGESGTGKSTTLKLILRLLVPQSGRVLIDGESIKELSFNDALRVRQKMGMVFQGAALFDSMSVFENVAYPLREHTSLSEDEIEARVREKLEFVDLDPDRVMQQLPSELSGGMRKRVGIARGMADNPEIMLYDEPTSGLDPLTTGTISRLIKKLQRELKVTSVVVSHDIRSVFYMATYVALLYKRRIHFFGTPEDMTSSDDPYIRDFLGGL
ncbi:MAG: ATP-binding cassette domain-containing protein [Gemmatimonadaceae bacterium]